MSVITLAFFGVLSVTGLSLIQQNQKTKQVSIEHLTAAQLAAATANWNSYTDAGYAAASGISLKYPPDWQINITDVKKVGNTTNPTAVVNERVVYLPTAETAQAEWNTCAATTSADACGAAAGDKTVSGSEITINGLDAYSATMQNSFSTYHVTVIRGNKSTADGIPYVELTTTTNDPAALTSFNAVMASATFPN